MQRSRREFFQALSAVVAAASVPPSVAGLVQPKHKPLAFHPHAFVLQYPPLDLAMTSIADQMDRDVLDMYERQLWASSPISTIAYRDPTENGIEW